MKIPGWTGIDKQCVWKFAVSSHTDQVRRPYQTGNAFLSSSEHIPPQRCTIRHGSNYSRSSAGRGYQPSRRHRKSLLRSVECFSTWTIPPRTSFPRKCPSSLIKEGKCPRGRRPEKMSGEHAGEMSIYPYNNNNNTHISIQQ